MTELMQRLDAAWSSRSTPTTSTTCSATPAFFAAYRKADFITSDSKYVYWSLGWIGRRIKEKVSGSDIVPTFCHHHRDNPDVKVFLLGAAPGDRADAPSSASTPAKAARSSSARTGRR